MTVRVYIENGELAGRFTVENDIELEKILTGLLEEGHTITAISRE